MEKIGMIGLGTMGHGIAENIMKNGYEMVLYDIRPEAMDDLKANGAEVVLTPQDLGKKVKTVLIMVNAFPHCVDAYNKLLETMHEGTIINMSTIAASDQKTLEKMANEKGVTMIDCPVSGGFKGAKEGTLTLMAGCSDQLYEKYEPLLKTFGQKVVHVGKNVGDGQAMKSINQLLVGVHMCATAEAFTLADKCGLDLDTVYDIIMSSAGASHIFGNRGKYLIERNFDTRSTLAIQLKDTSIVCKTADSVGAHTPLANTAREMFKLALNKYPPTEDSLAVAKLYEEISNLKKD